MAYYFGVEIEIIAEPHTVRHPLVRAFYYEKLAAALRNRGQPALADTLRDKYRKRAEHYDKWWITKDGSLKSPRHPLSKLVVLATHKISSVPPRSVTDFEVDAVPLEAVSPILSTENMWEEDIDTFWRAWSKVFHMPTSSRLCGSHVHVSASPDREFSPEELRRIAFGVIFYEDNVLQLLPEFRRDSKWCKPNSSEITACDELDDDTSDDGVVEILGDVRDSIWGSSGSDDTIGDRISNFMQGNNRRVLWNFQNVRTSGSVEFRGGPRLRGPIHTKRWIAFVVSFIHMCVSQNFDFMARDDLDRPDMEEFWYDIREAARTCQVKSSLPRDWETMQGSTSSDMSDLSDSDTDSDTSTVYSKNDSMYSDSKYDSDDKDEMILELGHDPVYERRSHRCVVM